MILLLKQALSITIIMYEPKFTRSEIMSIIFRVLLIGTVSSTVPVVKKDTISLLKFVMIIHNIAPKEMSV